MLSFRNKSFENCTENGHHFENGTVHTRTTTNNNNLHEPDDTPKANGTTNNEHHPRDQTYQSRDYPRFQERSFSGRSNRCRWRCKITANAIDAWSRVLFPLAYGLFIVAYWILYSSNVNDDKW